MKKHFRGLALALWLPGILLAPCRVFAQEEPPTPENKLFRAVEADDITRVKQLLNRGVNPNAENTVHYSPLDIALSRGRQINIVKLLLDKGAKVNTRDNLGKTPLMAWAEMEGDTEQAIKVLQLLLERGADIRARDKNGQTSLDYTMRVGYSPLARALLEHGAKVEDSTIWKPLHWAAFVNDTARLRSEIKAGAEINVLNPEGQTPLMIAAKEGNVAAIQTLLVLGADVNIQVENGGETALILAMEYDRLEAAKVLLVDNLKPNLVAHADQARGETALTVAVRRGDTELVTRLVELGADVNFRGYYSTPLIDLARYGSPELVKLLLDKGANVNDSTEEGMTALLSATYSNNENTLSIAKLLLDRGANVNPKNQDGITPLLCALDYNSHDEKLACLLVERGAEINVADKVGKTPLLWAAFFGYKDLMKLLLARGADL